MGDFEIDENLLKFEREVPPAIGTMQSKAQEIIEKNKKVAETSDACGDGMSGSYQTNNTAQAVQPYKVLAEGCRKIANEVQSKMIPLLAECSALAALIAELHEIVEKARACLARINQLKAIIAAKHASDPPQDTRAEEAELERKEQEFEELKALFKAKHEEAKAKLEELKGMDTSISNMPPTNGSLSFDPAIAADVQKGFSGREQYYNYTTGDQSITSIGS